MSGCQGFLRLGETFQYTLKLKAGAFSGLRIVSDINDPWRNR